jgi:hypothetical protein
MLIQKQGGMGKNLLENVKHEKNFEKPIQIKYKRNKKHEKEIILLERSRRKNICIQA